MAQIACDEMYAAQCSQRGFDILLERHGVEEKNASIVEADCCGAVADGDEIAIAEWRESIEWHAEGGDLWRDIANCCLVLWHTKDCALLCTVQALMKCVVASVRATVMIDDVMVSHPSRPHVLVWPRK